MAIGKEFRVTHEHLKLLRMMNVGWSETEYGAPEVDPKRPYGNSSVEEDIAEILGMTPAGDDGEEPCLSKAQRETCARLHRETETALQIALSTGKFREGHYATTDYGRTWTVLA